MSNFEIETSHREDTQFYKRLSYILEHELILHNGHSEQHCGLTNNLEKLITDIQFEGYPCQWYS